MFLLVQGMFAQPVKRPLSPEFVEKLRAQYGFSADECASLRDSGEITRFQDKSFSSLMFPEKTLASKIVSDMKALPAVILVEALFAIPVEKDLIVQDDFRLKIYNILHKIDTMKGLKYYSETDKRMNVMFNDSYVIANPDSRTALPNPVLQRIPVWDRIYVFQDDARFDENTYEATYLYSNNTYRLSMRNLTTMYYGIIPLVQPKKLLLDMIVLPGEDHILFYSCIGADTYTLFGLEKKALPSFSNRIKSLFSWFLQHLSED